MSIAVFIYLLTVTLKCVIFFNMEALCDNYVGVGSTGKDEEGDKHDLNQCRVLLKCTLCTKLWNLFF